MSIDFYRYLHILGLILLAFSLGIACIPQEGLPGSKLKKTRAISHGIGLLLLFVAGFGLLAKLQIHWPYPWWVYAKLLVWLGLGLSGLIFKKWKNHTHRNVLVFVILMMVASYIGISWASL